MALEHGDLFFINRSGSTYKIEAVELGNYLTGNSLDDGTYIVNDGLLSISNTGNDALQPFVITSANTPLNSVIDFDENFIVRSVGSDASITLNYDHVSSAILCADANGNTPGFSENNCGCISFDWDYFSDRLPCPDGGIVNDNGCLEINACDGGVIGFYSSGTPKEACVDVNLCGGGVINDGGCLDLDYALIANKIVCSPDSGLNNTAGDKCISVNFEKVMAEMGLGVLKSLDNSVLFTNNGDLTTGNVDLKVNPLVVQDTKINKIKASGSCLSIDGNNDLTQGDVIINLSDSCIQNLTGGTPGDGNVTINNILGGPGITVSPNGNLTSNNVTIEMSEVDEKGCWSDSRQAFTAQRVYVAKSGGVRDPGIVLGTHNSSNENANLEKWWVGISANQNNGSFILGTGRGWNNFEDCGGSPPPDSLNDDPNQGSFGNFFSVACGYNVRQNHKTAGLVGSKGDTVIAFIDTQKYLCGELQPTDPGYDPNNPTINYDGTCGPKHPQWSKLEPIFWPNAPGGAREWQPGEGSNAQEKKLYEDLFHKNTNPYESAGSGYFHFGDGYKIGRLNRLGFDKSAKFKDDFPEILISDTRVALGASDEERVTTIEALIDQIGNFSMDGGLVRSSLKSDDTSPTYPVLYFDSNELGTVAPSLVEYSYGVGSSELVYDDDGEVMGEIGSDDLSNVPVHVTNTNYNSLTILSLVAHRIRKKQVQDLQARVDSLEARLTAAGIP